MAVWRGFPWRKVPFYILAQLLGGIVGAGIVYGNYLYAIDIYEGGRHIRTLKTAGFFGTVPVSMHILFSFSFVTGLLLSSFSWITCPI